MQGFFLNDSTTKVHKNESHIIGNISNDPLFGNTTAEIYVQFKPTFYPFYFGNQGDTVLNTQSPFAGLDSAFVCLSYNGVWGDSSSFTPQNFEVKQVSDNNFR